MKLQYFLYVFVILTIASCFNNTSFAPQTFQSGNNSFDTKRLERIDSVLQGYVDAGTLPNVVTFVAKNGKVVHHKAYGKRDIEKDIDIQKNDIFRIASQTKAITSVALMTLYEKGMFLLDDPISNYIPAFKEPQVLVEFNEKDTTYTTRDAEREITIRDLLTHTSGIHYGILGGGVGNKMFTKEGIPAVNSLENVTIKEIANKIAKMPLLHDPGKRFTYGMNIDVLGYLIEVLSGQPFDVFMKKAVLDPLGMNETYFYLPEDKKDRLVTLYSSSENGLVYHTNESYQTYPYAGAQTFLSGGAGLNGTIEDYAKFCQMMLNKGTFNGKKILGRKTVELMTSDHLNKDVALFWGNKFGLGFELINNEFANNHLWSKGSYKWGGMYYTDYLIDPVENMILLIYTNVEPYHGPNIHYIFHNLVYQALE